MSIFSKIGKALKGAAKFALPIIGGATLGPLGGLAGGALGGLVSGGGLGGAVTGGLGGLAGGAALKGLGGISGIGSRLGSLFGGGGQSGNTQGLMARHVADLVSQGKLDPASASAILRSSNFGGSGGLGSLFSNPGRLAQLGLAGLNTVQGAQQQGKANQLQQQMLGQVQSQQADRDALRKRLMGNLSTGIPQRPDLGSLFAGSANPFALQRLGIQAPAAPSTGIPQYLQRPGTTAPVAPLGGGIPPYLQRLQRKPRAFAEVGA